MKYLVIGVGGTGGAIAAYLTKAGIDTTLIARGKNLSALRENGITLSLDNNEYTNAVKAFDMNGFENAVKSGAALSPDVIFVCVKGYSITDTIPFIKKRIQARNRGNTDTQYLRHGQTYAKRASLSYGDGRVYICFLKSCLSGENTYVRFDFSYSLRAAFAQKG